MRNLSSVQPFVDFDSFIAAIGERNHVGEKMPSFDWSDRFLLDQIKYLGARVRAGGFYFVEGSSKGVYSRVSHATLAED